DLAEDRAARGRAADDGAILLLPALALERAARRDRRGRAVRQLGLIEVEGEARLLLRPLGWIDLRDGAGEPRSRREDDVAVDVHDVLHEGRPHGLAELRAP